jgi:hypothetical protein
MAYWYMYNEHYLERTFHRCFLPSFNSFGWEVSEEKIKMRKVNGRRTPSDGKSSHCLVVTSKDSYRFPIKQEFYISLKGRWLFMKDLVLNHKISYALRWVILYVHLLDWWHPIQKKTELYARLMVSCNWYLDI